MAAKLTTLGAIATGDRAAHVSGKQLKLDGADGLDAEQFVSNNAKHAVATLLRDDRFTSQLDEAGFKASNQLEGRQFLNRILAARIETGSVLFDAFVDHLHDAIAIAEQKGPATQAVRTSEVFRCVNKVLTIKQVIKARSSDQAITVQLQVAP